MTSLVATGIATPSDRATSRGKMHENLVQIVRVVPEICWRTCANTQTNMLTNCHLCRVAGNTVIRYGMRVRVAVRLYIVANCYKPFAFTFRPTSQHYFLMICRRSSTQWNSGHLSSRLFPHSAVSYLVDRERKYAEFFLKLQSALW